MNQRALFEIALAKRCLCICIAYLSFFSSMPRIRFSRSHTRFALYLRIALVCVLFMTSVLSPLFSCLCEWVIICAHAYTRTHTQSHIIIDARTNLCAVFLLLPIFPGSSNDSWPKRLPNPLYTPQQNPGEIEIRRTYPKKCPKKPETTTILAARDAYRKNNNKNPQRLFCIARKKNFCEMVVVCLLQMGFLFTEKKKPCVWSTQGLQRGIVLNSSGKLEAC